MEPKNTNQQESFLEHALNIERNLEKKVMSYQQNAVTRFPFIFLGLSTFGGVAVFYGFEKIIDKTPYLADKPFTILVAGFTILLFTGALYRKLN
jgi:hypothetical protein